MAQLLVVILNEPAHLPALLDAWHKIGVPGYNHSRQRQRPTGQGLAA